MNSRVNRRAVLSGAIIVAAIILMTTVMSEPVAKAEPQAAAVAVPLITALVKAAPSIGSFFSKLFPKDNANKAQRTAKDGAVSDQNTGKTLLEGSITRQRTLAEVLRATSGAATGTAAMAQLVKNHTSTSDGEKVDLRQMWSEVSSKLKKIAQASPHPEVFEAGSEQKLALANVDDYAGSMPEEVSKEIEGKDPENCKALQKSLDNLQKALTRLSDAGNEELNVVADSLAAITLPEGQQTIENGKKKADELGSKGFTNMQLMQ